MSVDLETLNVCLENLNFRLIGLGILNVVLQIFSVLHCNYVSLKVVFNSESAVPFLNTRLDERMKSEVRGATFFQQHATQLKS